MKKKSRCHRLTNLPEAFKTSGKCGHSAMAILDEIVELYRIAKANGRDSFSRPNSYFMEVVGLSETAFTANCKELVKLGVIERTVPNGRPTVYHVHTENIDGWSTPPTIKSKDFTTPPDLETLSGEVFKPYNQNRHVEKNRYFVSNLARCWDKVRQQFLEERDGTYLSWSMDGEQVYIHRAVGELFVEIPEELRGQHIVVDHIDTHKKNNEATNLRWLTRSENARAQDVQERKVASYKRTLSEKKVEKENQDLVTKYRELSELFENSAKRNVEYLERVEEAERREFEAATKTRKLEAELERESRRANQL